MVKREIPAEEPDFDFLLSGLGASVADVSPSAPQSDEAATSASGVEDWPGYARGGESTTGNKLDELTAAGSTAPEAFGADFFSSKDDLVAEESKSFEFGEFPFAEEQAATQSGAVAGPEAVSGEMAGFDFGEFPFEEASDTLAESAIVPSKTGEFDFGANVFEADKSSALENPEGWGGVATGELEEELFTFGEEQDGLPTEDKGLELEPGQLEDAEESFDFGSVAVLPQQERVVEAAPLFEVEENKGTESESHEIGDIAFGETIFAGPGVRKREEIMPVSVSPEPVAKKPSAYSFASQLPSADEELPVLTTSSRRKGHSTFPIAMTAIAVMILLVIAGAGVYIFREGPAAFDKLGLATLAKWSGLNVVEEGGIAVKDLQGVFLTNQAGVEIFAISGEAVNNFKKPRASIQVKATVLGPKGETLIQKSAYCGNNLSKEQLTTLPMVKIEEAMGSPFGDSLANLGVQPGKGIPFVIVFSGVPKDAAEFSVEVAGSTVASQ